MTDHQPLDPQRVRQLVRPFAWVDVRLRHRLMDLDLVEIALLFFLHLAADRHGCSFWSDAAIARSLGLADGEVTEARLALVRKGFVLYRYPLFQLLPVTETVA
jgi:hypothetical protein